MSFVPSSQQDAQGYRDLNAITVGRKSRASRAYTYFVRTLKFLLPIGALLLIAAIALWPHLRSQDSRFRIGFSNIDISEAKDPSMVNARYVGTDDDNQPFSVTADFAKQIDPNTDTILLDVPKADITLDDGTWLILTADTGLYSRPDSSLDLEGAVTLFHDEGMELHTELATIDLDLGTAQGDQPVLGAGPFGTIKSEGFLLIDKGKTIIFTGKTAATLLPKQGNTP